MAQLERPEGGWLRAVRRASGLCLKDVGGVLGVTPQAIHSLEKSENIRSISLKQLDSAAGAMGFRVVYALVPLPETLGYLAAQGQAKVDSGSPDETRPESAP
jgi:transcriptional regulator with XRE-family HTH domain